MDADDMQETASGVDESRRLARRSMIKKSAGATAVAWTGAMLIDGIANPAAAASCTAGSYSLIYSSPGGSLTNHTTNPGVPGTAVKYGIVAGSTYSTTFSSSAFNHAAASPGNTGAITVAIGASCANCYIESVYAAIHLQGAGCCPTPYYAAAGTADKLIITAGGTGAGNKTVTIQPQTTVGSSACNTANSPANSTNTPTPGGYNVGLHWGAPVSTGCETLASVFNDGWVVINVKCT